MAKINLTLPKIDQETLTDQDAIQKVMSYLYQLNEQLRYELTHIDDENITEGGISEVSLSGNVNRRISASDASAEFSMNAGEIVARVNQELGDLSSEFSQRAGQIELTVSGKLDADAPSVGVSNAGIIVNTDGVELNTDENGHIVAIVGEETQLEIDQDGVEAPMGSFGELHASNIVEKKITDTVEWAGGIQATLDSMPKWLDEEITITIPAGEYLEDITIENFKGRKLTLDGSAGVEIAGTMNVIGCDSVTLTGGNALNKFYIHPAEGGDYTINVNSTQKLELRYLNVSGLATRTTNNDGTDVGVRVRSSMVSLYNCCIERTKTGAAFDQTAVGYLENCIGGNASSSADATTNTNLEYGVRSRRGSHVGLYGTGIKANLGSTVTANGGLITGTVTATQGDYSAGATVTKTKTYSITSSVTFRLNAAGTSTSATVGYQGMANAYSTDGWRGIGMWFGPNFVSDMSGKTINSATLKVKRATGGYSKALPVHLHTFLKTAPGGEYRYESMFKNHTHSVKVQKNSWANIPLSGDQIARLQEGYGLAIYEPMHNYSGTGSPDYTGFYTKGSDYPPVLSVTYQDQE